MSPLDNATDAELRVLEMMLREMRHSRAIRQPLTITFDPWTTPGCHGANLFFGFEPSGHSCEVEGEFKRLKKRAERTR